MPKKKKKRTKTKPAVSARRFTRRRRAGRVRPSRRVIKGKSLQGIKVIEPEVALEREIAEEDQDLRKAKVTGMFEGFREDRDKRREELKRFMTDLRRQRIKRRGAVQKFMRNVRQQVLEKKKMMPDEKTPVCSHNSQ